MRFAVSLVFASILLAALAGRTPVSARGPLNRQAPKTTAQRLRGKGWWPTRPDASRKDSVGTDSCAACHKKIVAEQQKTSMAHAAWKAAETEVLRSNPSITLNSPPFQTSITRERDGSTYTVAQGGAVMSGPILWSMGDGMMGQTFILRSGGNLFESQLTYFPSIRGLDLTPGHSPAAPADLDHAFGTMQNPEIAQRCFGCHTTASSLRNEFEPDRATPGVTCEACHGPGAEHVKAMRANQSEKGEEAILDPGVFTPVETVDFCGACHRAPMDVISAKDYVPINVRFQPYRLSKSRCWSKPDPRITCTACHDPHQQVVRDIVFYDAKCLACHASRAISASQHRQDLQAANRAPACKVQSSHCVSCHMPRYEVPQMHGSFTDHDIRIVRSGDPYPL
ncbi:MAG: multiheme c-type cytochrome [Terracidiphilus sp.]